MEPVYFFNLVNAQRGWLSARQSVVTQNIANANTPGYKAGDIAPFNAVLARQTLEIAGADPMHLHSNAHGISPTMVFKPADVWETAYSGNNVTLESELIKQSEIRSAFTLDTNLLKTIHGMWMTSLKG